MTGFAVPEQKVPARPAAAFTEVNARRGDLDKVRSFWRNVERYPAGVALLHRGAGLARRSVIVSGWACEMRILHDGRRQIFSFLLPGDPIDVPRDLGASARTIVALTRLELIGSEVLTPGDDPMNEAARAISEALDRRIDRLLDHMVRIGRLTASERLLNLLLDFHDRLEAVGLAKENTFRIPVTQEMFADALGLSIVHINRTLQQLRRDGLISLRSGAVTLHDRARLKALACYEPAAPEA